MRYLKRNRKGSFIVLATIFYVGMHTIALSQLIKGDNIKSNLDFSSFAIYDTANMLQLSKLMNYNTQTDFISIFLNGKIESTNYKSFFSTSLNDSISFLIMRLKGASPAAMRRCFIFFKASTGNFAYSNCDTVLLDTSSKMPLILITSIKARFFVQRAAITADQIINGPINKFWENYLNDDCHIYHINNVGLQNEGGKVYLKLKIENECESSAKDSILYRYLK